MNSLEDYTLESLKESLNGMYNRKRVKKDYININNKEELIIFIKNLINS
jgi:hypothetical protein